MEQKLTAQDLQIGDWVLYNNEPNIIAEVSELFKEKQKFALQ